MKLDEAMQIISAGIQKPIGFAVIFAVEDGRITRFDSFPDVAGGEAPIQAEQQAWGLAQAFAAMTVGRCIDVCVIRTENEERLPGRHISNRGPRA